MSLENQVVLITGANGGLGSHMTRAFLDADATVIGVARKIDSSEFPQPAFIPLPGDLSTSAGVKAVVEDAVSRRGRIDALVHLVGGFAGGIRIEDTDEPTWEKMFALNLNPAFHLAGALVPVMRKAGRGRVIAIGARPAFDPVAGLGAYSASKAALVSMVRTLALEVKDAGITANLILPGAMDTPANRAAMPDVPPQDFVRPENVASLALWLVSEAGSQTSGAAIPMYGRWL